MKNILSLCIIGILLMSGVGAAVVGTSQPSISEMSQSVSFSSPILEEKEGYLLVSFGSMNAWVDEPEFPMIPAYQQTFTVPFGSKIKAIHVTFSEEKNQMLSRPLLPASSPIVLLEQQTTIPTRVMNEEAYASLIPYPNSDYTYQTGGGLDGLTHVTYVTITCYPVHYTAGTNLLSWSDHVDIMVQYEEPAEPLFPQTYVAHTDLLIVAPDKFTTALQPLIDHKNSFGVNTTLITVEDILNQFEGRDAPEKIKYCIKNELDTTGIHYVLLVGGLNSLIYAIPKDDVNQGTKDWYVPVRYTNLWDGGTTQDTGYLCDLYYADIYDGEENFSSWDSNGNDVFAEWKGIRADTIDLFPDVYVGRLACRNTIEVKTMVKKIINYEKTAADPSWFKKMVVIGGDTFNDVSSTNFYEGEVETQKSLDYMTGFEPVKIWASHRNTSDLVPVPWDIVTTVMKGCGFLAFAGHGSPERWNTYWPESFEETRARGLWWWDIPLIFNGEKLPVCVVGGCHNSQFNVTATGFLFKLPWVYGPIPECFSWLLTKKIRGGTIATMGNTGLGYGAVGDSGDRDGDGINDPDCVEVLGGYLESQFFKAYGVNHTDVLGETWGAAITKYLEVYPGMSNKLDCKTVQQWVLFGDPSLKIGGYES